MLSNNPLKQYFRRPSIYISLPSKLKFYDKSTIDTEDSELPVYPMSSIDEITARTPDAVVNGQAVVDIIKSCVPSIKDPWKINNIDIDTLFIAIKVATSGEFYDVISKCPSCSEESTFSVNLVEILNSVNYQNEYDETLKISELEIKFRPLTFREANANGMTQYRLQRNLYDLQNMEESDEKTNLYNNTVAEVNKSFFDAVTSTIEYIKTPSALVSEREFILEFLLNTDRTSSSEIRDKSISLTSKTKLKPMNIKCPHCGHEHNQELNLNITDFFE